MSKSAVARTATVLLVATLALTGCAADEAGTGSPGATSESPRDYGSTASSSPSETAGDAVEVAVSVRDGEVEPPTRRVEVEQGQQVRLIITSDVDDEVHVHGIDVESELQAGQPATLEFVADQTGLFEVETHETELLLLQLEIR